VKSYKRLREKTWSYDRSRRTWYKKPPKVPPPPPKKWLIRQTLAINFVHHRLYYAIVLQAWSYDEGELRAKEKEHGEELIRALEKHLKYGRDDWWFPHQYGVAYQRVPFHYGLLKIGKEIRLEQQRKKVRRR